jgi:cyclic-di-GMP phosphodiesterase, flagellum assembly factor TipF
MKIAFSLTPSRAKALALGLCGLFAAALGVVLLPDPWNMLAGIGLCGLSLLGASFLLDATLRQDIERIFAILGEIKVRMAQSGMRMEALAQRIDQQPMAAADAAPARATLAEISAEVGILGGLLQNVAQTLNAHEERLNEAVASSPEAVPPAVPTPVTVAELSVISAGLRSGAPVPEPLHAEADEQVQAMQLALDAARAEEIAAAISRADIEIHLQPIVQLPQRRTIGYEAFLRLRLNENNLLLPAEFLHVVEERGLSPTMDALVLTRVLAIARYLAARPGEQFITCNISPVTWGNPRAVASIARLVENYRAFAGRLVLEVPQRVFRALDPASLGLLGGMSAVGVRFALDQLSDLRLDPASLADRGVRFVKAPVGLLMAAEAGRVQLEIAVADLAPMLARAGIVLLGEKVEDDRSAADLIDLNITHAQGILFSPPRLARPEVFAEPKEWTAAQDAVPTPAEMAELKPGDAREADGAAEVRRSFRSVLRQASA